MSDNKELSRLRTNLIYNFDTKVQRDALQALWLDGGPEALTVMVEALKAPQVAIKDEIISFLSFRDQEVVYVHLCQVIDESSNTVRKTILDSIESLDLKSRFLDKIERFKTDASKFKLLAAMVRFLGKLRDQEIIDSLGRLIDIESDEVRLALIDALEYSAAEKCPGYILDTMKLFSPRVSVRALDLIADFQDDTSVLPLLNILGEVGGLMSEKIVDTLQGFDQDRLPLIVQRNATGTDGKPDEGLLRSWCLYLEKTGRKKDAANIRQQHQLQESEPKVEDECIQTSKILAFELSSLKGVAILRLNGKLNLHSLAGFELTLKFIIRSGYHKIVLVCECLLSIDHHAIAYLEETNKKLQQLLGGIRYTMFKALTEAQRKTLMPSAEIFKDVAEAVESFSLGSLGTVIKIDESSFSQGDQVEVQYSIGRFDKIRAATVLYTEKNRLSIAWEILDEKDVFISYENDKVKFTFARDNERYEAKTKVIEQSDLPESHVKLMLPRIARLIERRESVLVKCRLLAIFQKILEDRTVDKTEFPGVCVKMSEEDMLVMSPVPLPEGANIVVTINPTDLDLGKVVGRISKRTEYIHRKKRFYEYQVTFVTVLDKDRIKIKKFVFNRLSVEI